MSEEKKTANKIKYPKIVIGAFIFNEQGELLLTRQPRLSNKFTCVGGKVEVGETIKETVIRETKEETGLQSKEVEFIDIIDGLGLDDIYKAEDNHLIFVDYKVNIEGGARVKLNDEATEYKWLKPEDWLKLNKSELAHKYVIEVIKKLQAGWPLNFEHKYKRALADYQNLLKQTTKEKFEFAKFANEQILYEILPVYDNLKISLAHVNKEADKNGWVEGIKHVIKQFREVLKNSGVEEIKTEGEKFNPQVMEAVEGKGSKVKKEVKPGYKLHGKVIVPAKVMIE